MNNEFSIRRSPCGHAELYNVYMTIMKNNMFVQNELNLKIFNKSVECCSEKLQHSTNKRPILCGCVFDKHGNIVSKAFNSYKKSHPIQKMYAVNESHIFLHAEMKAMISACKILGTNDLSEYSVTIARLCRDGRLGQSFPCDGCFSAMTNRFNIKSATYFDEIYGVCTIDCKFLKKNIQMPKLSEGLSFAKNS